MNPGFPTFWKNSPNIWLGDCKVFHKRIAAFDIKILFPMNKKTSPSDHMTPTFVRGGMFVLLLLCGLSVLSSVSWIYHRIQNRLGFEIADVVVAFLVILILVLILLGFGVGFGADRLLRRKRFLALRIHRFLKRNRIMHFLWHSLETTCLPRMGTVPEAETPSIPTRTPRRGRPPTYSLDRWMRVVHAWENRDPLRNTMTLSEFLAEQFGTHADGSPRMSENSFYDWRKKVFVEWRRQDLQKNNPGH